MKSVNRWLLSLILVTAAATFGAACWFWQFAYSSDFAMIGLIAKHWLEKGELSLFVCNVGYQGMILDETLMGAAFRFFGITPRVLYLVPTAFLALALFLFHRVVRSAYGTTVAHLATFAMLLSSPSVYEFAARPQPNLGEIWAIGLGLVLAYLRLQKKPTGAAFALTGFLAGFGLYTYGLVVYFIGICALHWLFTLRKEAGVSWREWLRPAPKGLRIAAQAALGGVACAAALFVVTAFEDDASRTLRMIDPITFLRDLTLVWALLTGAGIALRYRTRLRAAATQWAALAIGFFAGFAPSLYYRFVLHGPGNRRMEISGTGRDFLARIELIWRGDLRIWRVFPTTPARAALLAVILAIGLYGLRRLRRGLDRPRETSPLLALPVVVFGACFFGASTVNVDSARYTLSLFFFSSLAIALAIDRIARMRRSVALRALLATPILCLLAHQAAELYANYAGVERPYELEPVIAELDRLGLARGVGDYWLAHSIAFLTKERIEIEPLQPNYCGWYSADVKKGDRVASLDWVPNAEPMSVGQAVRVLERDYRVTAIHRVGRVDIRVLEKLGQTGIRAR